MFTFDVCKQDPDKLFSMPVRKILWLYDLAVKWRELTKPQK